MSLLLMKEEEGEGGREGERRERDRRDKGIEGREPDQSWLPGCKQCILRVCLSCTC